MSARPAIADTPTQAPAQTPSAKSPTSEIHVDKAKKLVPGSPASDASYPITKSSINAAAAIDGIITDDAASTPSAPAGLKASSYSLSFINATWTASKNLKPDVEYMVNVSNSPKPTGENVLLVWQSVGQDTSASIRVDMSPNQTYYFVVKAEDANGQDSQMVVSSAIHPVWANLGQPSNKVHIVFSSYGLDADGNVIDGWSAEQRATISAFYGKMYPILVQLYGPPSTDVTVTLVKDLAYSGSNIFLPGANEIHMDINFYPQLFTHEVVHAFRNDYILTSGDTWGGYNSTLSGFEEGFAQAVSYEAMNQYFKAYPNDPALGGEKGPWDSSQDWDYDFQNMPEIRGTDYWSDSTGTGIYWLRYEMGAAATRKINLEVPDYYKLFNQEYYRRINANHALHPTRALMVDIIKSITPQIEGQPAAAWINDNYIYYAKDVIGEKIFHNLQNYQTATNYFVFQNLYFTDTMWCGSEWACPNDNGDYTYYHLNGSKGSGSLIGPDGKAVWSDNLLISPAQNPPAYNAIGNAEKDLATADTINPWPGGDPTNYVLGIKQFGLYKFNASFTDPVTKTQTSNSIYTVLGSQLDNDFSGVWGGVPGHQNGTIYLNHEGFADEPGIPVVKGAFIGTRSWTGTYNNLTSTTDSAPGKVYITFVDSDTGQTYHAQRNISYGSGNGSQMFLLDFSAPTLSITAPAANQTVYGNVAVKMSATDNVGVNTVTYTVDGKKVGDAPLAPYGLKLDTTDLSNGRHVLAATASDASGNSATSNSVTFNVNNSAPHVTFGKPANVVTGKISLSATASGDFGVSKVEFYRDNGVLIGADTAGPYAATLDTGKLAQGSLHKLYAKATGKNGQTATSAVYSITIKDTVAPAVRITSPQKGSRLDDGKVKIEASASDNTDLAEVNFYVNGDLKCSDKTAPYSCTWKMPDKDDAKYYVTAKAFDRFGNSKANTISVWSK
jgi:hypothetical protein